MFSTAVGYAGGFSENPTYEMVRAALAQLLNTMVSPTSHRSGCEIVEGGSRRRCSEQEVHPPVSGHGAASLSTSKPDAQYTLTLTYCLHH